MSAEGSGTFERASHPSNTKPLNPCRYGVVSFQMTWIRLIWGYKTKFGIETTN